MIDYLWFIITGWIFSCTAMIGFTFICPSEMVTYLVTLKLMRLCIHTHAININ